MKKNAITPLFLQCFTLLFFALTASIPVSHAAPTGREIALLVDAADSSQDNHRQAVMVIERDKQKLIRKLEIWSKKFGKDKRSLIRFVEPVDIQDTQFLSWSYDASQTEDDLWVYFPTENLVRRISGGGKKSAFMRSDFALEDMETRSVDDDRHDFIEMSRLNQRPVYVIESKPIAAKAKETNYSKRKVWVDAEYNLPVKIEYFDTYGNSIKTLEQGGFENINGIWTATKLVMQNTRRNTKTMMQYVSTKYNTGVNTQLFDQNNLRR